MTAPNGEPWSILRLVPMFVIRRIVRRNPWLLADHGVVNDVRSMWIGPLEIEVEAAIRLRPSTRAKLQAEAHAGTLFPERGPRPS